MNRSRPAAQTAADSLATMFRQTVAVIATLALLWVVALATPAAAQDGPQGIGFAQAEEGTWSCRGGNPVTAMDCARSLCNAEGGGQECFRTAWCYPSGWAGMVTVMLPEFHSTYPVCGAPSMEGLIAMMEALCNNAPYAQSCYIVGVTDQFGVGYPEAEREITPTPGTATVPAGK